jgi:hypothetical protein
MTRPSILAAALVALAVAAPSASARPAGPAPPSTLAVIGDTPYGAAQLANFPSDIARINADPAVSRVLHLGDIKSGSTVCSDAYFAQIRSAFDSFADPVVFTPGDNEWTDCHRVNNGGFRPTERLRRLREVFFPVAGRTLGATPATVTAQRGTTRENVRWEQSGVQFATLHVVGSNNGLAPWFGGAETATQTAERLAEVEQRTRAALEWIDRTFVEARRTRSAGVVLAMQADTWDPAAVAAGETEGFEPIIARIAKRARAFHRPVLLLQGDSHRFKVDQPIERAPNLTRIVVQGSTECPHEYLRLRVDPATEAVFSWERVTLPLAACAT